MDITANPWSILNTDPATAAITALTGLTLNADGTVTITSAALTFNTTGIPAQWFTVIGATNAAYNGLYKLLIGASGGTSFTMAPQFSIPAGTAQSGGGTLAQCFWPWAVRIEDISWQNAAAAGNSLDLRNADGKIIWQATATGAGAQNRGKLFWVSGLTPITITAGVVLLTID